MLWYLKISCRQTGFKGFVEMYFFSYNYLPSLSRKLETLILTGTLGGEKRTGVIETIKRELPKCDVVV